jgi:hypothetical protein
MVGRQSAEIVRLLEPPKKGRRARRRRSRQRAKSCRVRQPPDHLRLALTIAAIAAFRGAKDEIRDILKDGNWHTSTGGDPRAPSTQAERSDVRSREEGLYASSRDGGSLIDDERGEQLAERILALWPGAEDWGAEEEAQAKRAAVSAEPTEEATGPAAPLLAEAGSGQQRDTAGAEARATGGASDLERCAELLRQAAPIGQVDVVNERFGVRARLDFIDTVTVKCAYLDVDLPGELPLRLYPGDTLEQARTLYADKDRCERLLALRERGWEIEPSFHFGFMTRGLTWTRSRLTADEYVGYWEDRIESATAVPREDWDAELERLIEDGIFDPGDVGQFRDDFVDTARTSASPRPGLSVTYRWPALLNRTLQLLRGRAAQAAALPSKSRAYPNTSP